MNYDATPEQIGELIGAIEMQVQALAYIPETQYYAQSKKLLNNIETLAAWTNNERYRG